MSNSKARLDSRIEIL